MFGMTHPTRAHWNFRSSSIHLPLAIHGAAAKLTKISGSGALGAQTAAYGKSGRVRGLGRCRRVEMGPSCIILYRRMIMCVCVCQTCLSAQSLQQLCMWVQCRRGHQLFAAAAVTFAGAGHPRCVDPVRG